MNVRYYNHNDDSYALPNTVNFTSNDRDDAPLTNENAETNYLNKTQTTAQTVESSVEFKQGIIVNGVQEFNGDLETSDGILEHLITEASIKPSKNFGSMAQYTDNTTNKYKGYLVEKDTDRLYIFTNEINKPTQETNLNSLSKGTVVIRNPINIDEATTKYYVDDELNKKLDKSGGFMTGQLNMNNNRLLNIALTPILGREATCKDYVDGLVNGRLSLNGGTMSGDINLNGNDLINCDVVRPQGISLQLLSQNQAGGMRILNTLLDIYTDVRLNDNNITFLADGINDNDAVNLKQLKEFNKQAYNLTGSSSNNGIGTHTFTLPTTLTASTQFLITITLKMNFTGTFSATNQINAQIQQLKNDNSQITSNTDNFYVNINDLGSFKFINGVSKTIITAQSLTKKLKINLFDNYPSGTSKSFNHMLEIERL